MIPLASDIAGGIGQLVLLLIVALVAWATKRAAEAEKKKQQQAQPPEGHPDDEPVQRPPPVPHRHEHPVEPSTGRRPRSPPRVEPHVGHLDPDGLRSTTGTRRIAPRGAVDSTPDSTGRVKDSRLRRLRAWRRLAGGVPVKPGPGLVRGGILWSEVLGPPRALTGPHRSPTARRRP